MQNGTSKIKNLESGEAIISCTLVLAFIFSIFTFTWQTYQSEDLRNSIWQAANGAFTDLVSPGFLNPFVFKRTEILIPYDENNPTDQSIVSANLQRMGAVLINAINTTSDLAASAESLQCRLRLGYLNLEQGKVASSTPILWAGAEVLVHETTGPFTVDSDLAAKLSDTINKFSDNSVGTVLVGPDSLYQLPGEITPTSVYFPYAPFLAWGCSANPGLMASLGGKAISVGITFLPRS